MRIGPFGVWEILIILVVVLLIFGPRRLPEMAKGLGQSVRAFRKEMRDLKEDFDVDGSSSRTDKKAPPTPVAPPVGTPDGAEARATEHRSGGSTDTVQPPPPPVRSEPAAPDGAAERDQERVPKA